MNVSAYHTRSTFILMFLIFFLPMIMSWLLYLYHDHFSLKPRTHGVLLTNPINTSQVINLGKHKWRMLYKKEDCQEDEMNIVLFRLHQMRKAMGKDKDRIELLVLAPENCAIKNYHDFSAVVLQDTHKASFEKAMRSAVQNPNDKIYLIDPHDNLFMYFAALENPVYIYKDVKKLLNVSQIG